MNSPTQNNSYPRVADEMLVDTVDRFFAEHSTPERIQAAEGSMDRALFAASVEMGLTTIGIAESLGGSGGTLHDAAAVMYATGYHAVAAPVADVLAAALIGAVHGLSPAEGVTVALTGPRIPWWGVVDQVLWADGNAAAASLDVLSTGVNYAGEPFGVVESRDTLAFANDILALTRAAQMAGALQRVSELSVQYSVEREQFGKPIGKQQILQHYLAQMAGDAAAALGAVDNAVDVWRVSGTGSQFTLAVAAAKTVSGRMVSATNRNAHQLHGAIGYTDEHRLQYWTRRLWAWRDDFGTEVHWAAILGRALVSDGGRSLWPFVTSLPPALGSPT
jgi:acyl-CoA dehydrogenase